MTKKIFTIGIIGFGNIGKKRYDALKKIKIKKKIVYIVDIKNNYNLKNILFYKDWRKVININVDLIIIATPTSISEKILKKIGGKFNILVEKPGVLNFNLMKKITKVSNQNKKIFKIGYNLRFDTAFIKLKKIIKKNIFKKIYYVKIIYANGAAKTNTNNVGSLIDMGSHSINLIDCLFDINKKNIVKHFEQYNEFLKKTKNDNGYLHLQKANIHILIQHGFCTWKNEFKLEIFSSKGFVMINSLTKWGKQQLLLGIRKFPSGIPKIKKFKFNNDNTWYNELLYVIRKINSKKNDIEQINSEGIKTLEIVNEL